MGTGNPPGRPSNVRRFDGDQSVALIEADAFFQTGGQIGQLRGNTTALYHGPPYNEEYAASALEALKSGITLREHCRTQKKFDPKYPDPQQFYAWAVDNVAGFALRYAQARRLCLQHWAEEIIEIAEDGRNDWQERRKLDGTITKSVDHECVQRSKLRIDTRRWLLSKLLPHEYGDKIMHQQLGANGMPVDPPSAVQPIDLSIALQGWKPRD